MSSGHSTLRRHSGGGGEYLRLVKSVKRCLKKTISGPRLTYQEPLTVIIEVKMILNCRPLPYVSSEDSEEPLTPSHLVCGHRIMSLQGQVKLKTATQTAASFGQKNAPPKKCHEPLLEEMEERVSTQIAKFTS